MRTILWVLCAVFVLWAGALGPACADSSLELSIAAAAQSSLPQDSPFLVKLTVTNIGKSESRFHPDLLDPSTSGVILTVADARGEEHTWGPGYLVDMFLDPKNEVSLSPGESYSRLLDMTLDHNNKRLQFFLHKSGGHTLTASGRDFKTSKPLLFSVYEPIAEEQAAHDLLYGARGEHIDEIESPKDSERLETFLRLYPDSVYAKHARMLLAELYARRHDCNNLTPARKENVRKASELFSGLCSENGLYGARAAMMAGREYACLRNFYDAERMMEKACFAPQTATETRLRILSAMYYVEAVSNRCMQFWLPGREFAKAFGLDYTVRDGVACITSSKVKAVFASDGVSGFSLNGVNCPLSYLTDYESSLGDIRLSVLAAKAILAKHYETHHMDYMMQKIDPLCW